MKNIKAIIFDAYGTLFDVNSAAEKYKDKIEKSSRKDRENVLVEAFKDFIVKL